MIEKYDINHYYNHYTGAAMDFSNALIFSLVYVEKMKKYKLEGMYYKITVIVFSDTN